MLKSEEHWQCWAVFLCKMFVCLGVYWLVDDDFLEK